MTKTSPITFIVPVGSDDVVQRCFLSSPLFAKTSHHQILLQRGFSNAGLAFNDGISKAVHDVLVFAHEDVVFPNSWAEQFMAKLESLEEQEQALGVVGCIGMASGGKVAGHIYRHDRQLRSEGELPSEVETLDGLLISFRKSSGLRFDPDLPGFYLYGVDMCMQARSNGLKNYAVDVPCFHQSKTCQKLSSAFFAVNKYVVKKWRHMLPIETTMGTIGRVYILWDIRKRLWNLKRALVRATGLKRGEWWDELPQIDPTEKLSNHSDT